MVNSVSYNGLNAGVASPISKTTSFKGDAENVSDKPKVEKEGFKLTPEKIREKTDEFSENVDAFANSIDKTTDSVTNAVTKTTGATALIGAAFGKIIPTPVKDFFATPQFTVNEVGEKVLQKVKGSDGIERVVRKFNGKNTLIALGVLASVISGYALYKYIKNRPPKTPKPDNAVTQK